MSTTDALDAGLPAPSESEEVKVTEQNTPPETAADGVVEQKQDAPPKTFTQEEVDAMVQKRLLKEQRRISRDLERKLADQQSAKALVPPERESFRDDEAYQQAQIDHLVEKKAAEKLAERERALEAERRSESFQEKAEKAVERYSDFHAVVGNPALPINESMAEFIAESELGADVAYHLGKHPTQAAQIAQMSPVKAARELARIEAEIASKPKAQPSKAPAPIDPVGSRGKSSTSSLPSDEDDIETWMRKETERLRKR